MTGWNTEHDVSRTTLAVLARVMTENTEGELDCTLQSISAFIEGSVRQKVAGWQDRSQCRPISR
jgi:hypothetical protein